ncbi:MAG: hypothetical protein OEV08_09425, partial [Nitrospira sp.]|nr:hypothetical protein [Nitrospira sp.]
KLPAGNGLTTDIPEAIRSLAQASSDRHPSRVRAWCLALSVLMSLHEYDAETIREEGTRR